MSLQSKAIGGYFELELPQALHEKYPDAHKYQSARAAFFALLEHQPNIKRVWMPYYICDSMLAPVHATGKELVFYSINERFAIKDRISLAAHDLLLYVNYFGVCDGNVVEVLAHYDPAQVVIDCSQAFYSGPFECLANIYSPRKFFGVPDGGLLITNQTLKPPTNQDRDSIKRCCHLLKRLAFSAETGYESYKAAESSLNDLIPKVMSQLTQQMLSAIDYAAVEKKRTDNFNFLKSELGASNTLNLEVNHSAPLCYPYIPRRSIKKKYLLSQKIFIPTYWPEVLKKADDFSFEKFATEEMVAVPCDQRCNPADLNKVILELKNELFS